MHEQRPQNEPSVPKLLSLYAATRYASRGGTKLLCFVFVCVPKRKWPNSKAHTLGLGSLGNEGSDYEMTMYLDTGGYEAASRPSFLETEGKQKEGDEDDKCSWNKITACDSEGRIC